MADSAVGASYSKQAAASLGVSERTVRQDLARGKKIAPEVLAEVQGTDLDKGVVLDQLAATPRHEQQSADAKPGCWSTAGIPRYPMRTAPPTGFCITSHVHCNTTPHTFFIADKLKLSDDLTIERFVYGPDRDQ